MYLIPSSHVVVLLAHCCLLDHSISVVPGMAQGYGRGETKASFGVLSVVLR